MIFNLFHYFVLVLEATPMYMAIIDPDSEPCHANALGIMFMHIIIVVHCIAAGGSLSLHIVIYS